LLQLPLCCLSAVGSSQRGSDGVPCRPRPTSALPVQATTRSSGRDRWDGKRVVGGMLPRINIGADVRGESNIMTSVYQRWCSSTLHIRWGLCDRVCLVLVCWGRYGLGGWFFSSFWDRLWAD
jgi:hypothetical protein